MGRKSDDSFGPVSELVEGRCTTLLGGREEGFWGGVMVLAKDVDRFALGDSGAHRGVDRGGQATGPRCRREGLRALPGAAHGHDAPGAKTACGLETFRVSSVCKVTANDG